jgi:hypothetical protein
MGRRRKLEGRNLRAGVTEVLTEGNEVNEGAESELKTYKLKT